MIILKETIHIKTIIQTILIKTIIRIDKHKVKYTITACIPKLLSKIFYFFSLLYIRVNEKIINFNNEKIKKSDFCNKNKKIFNIDDINVNKILISKKEIHGEYNSFKYFIGYNDNDVIRPLYLFLSQTTGYINKFDKNKIAMSLIIKDIQLLKNSNKIWKKIEKLMKMDFNSKTTYGDDDKYIKAKIKKCKDSIITNFYDKIGFKEVPEEKIPHEFLSTIILDSVIYAYEKYYRQTFSEECKYVKINIRTKNYIDMELKSESDSDSDSDIYIKE